LVRLQQLLKALPLASAPLPLQAGRLRRAQLPASEVLQPLVLASILRLVPLPARVQQLRRGLRFSLGKALPLALVHFRRNLNRSAPPLAQLQ
jgi:hypothetical protein